MESDEEVLALPMLRDSKSAAWPGAAGLETHLLVDDDSGDEAADRDLELLQEACLPVSGEPMPPTDEFPNDADAYLRQVQWERLHIPAIVDVDVPANPPKQRKKRGVVGSHGSLLVQIDVDDDVPPEVGYCPEWAEDVAAAFRQLRLHCDQVREEASASATPFRLPYADWRERCEHGRPATLVLAAQDFISINHLVVAAVDALVDFCEPVPDTAPTVEDDTRASADAGKAQNAQVLDQLCEWAFAALAFIELPLIDDTQYQLQRLRRTCKKMVRDFHSNGLAKLSSEGLSDQACALPHAKVNLLLVIVTDVFNQR